MIFTRGSGCYGINGADTVSYDAALLSQAAGRPVRVQLSRRDEMAWENYGFAYVIEERVGLDSGGAIVAWDHESWSPSLGGRPGYNQPGNVVTGMLAGFPAAPFAPRSPAPPPSGGFNNGANAAPSYMTGRVGDEAGGTGTVSWRARADAHDLDRRSSPDRCARRAVCRTPSRTSRSWTRSRRASRPIRSRIVSAICATRV